MYFVANWKMNPPLLKEAERLISQLKALVKGAKNIKDQKIIICPPAIFLPKLGKPNSSIRFGVQNVGFRERGAFTGEISVMMAKDQGAEFSIIGHSERRQYFGENIEACNEKIKLCLAHRVTPIYCVGETLEEKKAGKTRKVIQSQLEGGLRSINLIDAKNVIVCYEPVWAISSAKDASADTPDNVLGINILIRRIIKDLYESNTARKMTVLYGGSVNSENAPLYVKNKSTDGFLVGSASLHAGTFFSLIKKSVIQKQNVG